MFDDLISLPFNSPHRSINGNDFIQLTRKQFYGMCQTIELQLTNTAGMIREAPTHTSPGYF